MFLEILIFLKNEKNWDNDTKKIPKTEVTMTKKAKVSYFFSFDLHFCMTMPLRGW